MLYLLFRDEKMATASLTLGEIIYIAVKPIFKIYLIIGVGFYLARKNILNVETSRDISTIAIKVLIPCLTFEKVVTNLNNTMIKEIATIVIVAYFMMFSQAIIVFAVGVMVGCPRNWWGGLLMCGLIPNISDIPIAYLQTLETSNVFPDINLGVSFVVIFLSLQMILQFTLGAYKLIEFDFKRDLKHPVVTEDEENFENEDLHVAHNVSKSSTQDSSIQDCLPRNTLYNNPSDDELSSIDSSGQHSVNQIHKITENMSRNLTNSSKFSTKTGKLSLPGHILDNSQAGTKAEGLEDIVKVYSRYNDLVQEHADEKQPDMSEFTSSSVFVTILKSIKNISWKNAAKEMFAIWKDSLSQPASIMIVVSIAVAMIPWLQALFVNSTQVRLPSAPDGEPPLSFLMDFASYIGASQVPFGLLLLGGTIGRLRVKQFPKRLLAVPVSITFLRLFIFPIMGCAFNYKLYKDGLFYGQDILYFISNIDFCIPPATSLLYLTAFYTPADGKSHIQIDLLALVYIFHYICLAICLPFVSAYTMKISLGF